MSNKLSTRNNHSFLSPWTLGGSGLFDFFNDFDNIFNKPLSKWHPETDIIETENNYQLSIDLPGVPLENIEITSKDGTLTIAGERKSEDKIKDKHYYRLERSYGKFVRSFKLPEDVVESNIKAAYKNGVLSVTIPKTVTIEQEPEIKKIPINSDDS